MGCDIHLCVEKRRIKKGWFVVNKRKPGTIEFEKVFKQVITEPKDWSPCEITREDTWSNRCYGMFAKLSDVRNYWGLEHIELRGFPEDASLNTFRKYTRRVVPDESYNSEHYYTVPESRANYYLENGYSVEKTPRNPPKHWKDYKFITHPDYHSPNWCSCRELEDAVKEIFFKEEIGEYVDGSEEWLALANYMKGLEMAGFETRCVFWFDN